jgi:hypothetical protein
MDTLSGDRDAMTNLSAVTYNASLIPAQTRHTLGNTSRAQYANTCLTYDFVIEAVMMGIFCIFGFVGNSLSMICLSKDKSKTATPFLLISLEIADTFFLITVVILRVLTSIYQYTLWPESMQGMFPYFGSYVFPLALIANMATNYLTILVTVNRYISVCRPYEASNLCSVQQARKQVVVVWILCILYNIPRFFESVVDTRYSPVTGENKTRSFPTEMTLNKVYQYVYGSAMYFIFFFLIPLITLIILNYKLIYALRETQKRRAKLLTHDSHSRSEDDITITLIVVVLVFLISQTPALITQVLLSSMHRRDTTCPTAVYYYFRLSDLLVVANSASNFIIYCFCSKRFRQILIQLVCASKLGGSPENSAMQNSQHAVKHYKPVALKEEKEKNGAAGTHVTAV